jgi:hypothetical protein
MKQLKSDKLFLSKLLLCGFLFICLLGCSKGSQGQKGRDAEAIAKEACQEVGVVEKTSKGTKGAPIIILEENHASRAGQIQHAITLVRLLREGEISCAEFMRLVYDDIFLHPIETISEYGVELDEEASVSYLKFADLYTINRHSDF